MASKPRKAFDGVARPQGFIDDTAKAVVKGIKRAVKRSPYIRGTQFPKNQSLSPRKFKKIYGKDASAKNKLEREMYNKARAAELRLKNNSTYGKGEYDIEGLMKSRAADRADVAAFMTKKRGRK